MHRISMLCMMTMIVVNILTDEDFDDTTVTFTTDYPSTVYALVYKDMVATP